MINLLDGDGKNVSVTKCLLIGRRYLHPHRWDPTVKLQPAQRTQRHGRPPGQRQQHPEWPQRPKVNTEGLCTWILCQSRSLCFCFCGKREKGVYEGKFPEKMQLKKMRRLAQFPVFALITMVLLFVFVRWEGESMFPGRWSSWVCFRPPLIRACLLIGTHGSGCMTVRNFWQSGVSVRVWSLLWHQMN